MNDPTVEAFIRSAHPSLSAALRGWSALMALKEEFDARVDQNDAEVDALFDYYDTGRVIIQDMAAGIRAEDAGDLLDKVTLACVFFETMAEGAELDDEGASVTSAEARSLRGMLAAIRRDLEILSGSTGGVGVSER